MECVSNFHLLAKPSVRNNQHTSAVVLTCSKKPNVRLAKSNDHFKKKYLPLPFLLGANSDLKPVHSAIDVNQPKAGLTVVSRSASNPQDLSRSGALKLSSLPEQSRSQTRRIKTSMSSLSLRPGNLVERSASDALFHQRTSTVVTAPHGLIKNEHPNNVGVKKFESNLRLTQSVHDDEQVPEPLTEKKSAQLGIPLRSGGFQSRSTDAPCHNGSSTSVCYFAYDFSFLIVIVNKG